VDFKSNHVQRQVMVDFDGWVLWDTLVRVPNIETRVKEIIVKFKTLFIVSSRRSGSSERSSRRDLQRKSTGRRDLTLVRDYTISSRVTIERED
jgi:hypothetical protein